MKEWTHFFQRAWQSEKGLKPLSRHTRHQRFRCHRESLEQKARLVMTEQDAQIDYKFGTIIELPREALTVDRIAAHAEFFSYGTNDLTQTTYGISRDGAEAGFLIEYMERRILPDNPFTTLDKEGVAELMRISITIGMARSA